MKIISFLSVVLLAQFVWGQQAPKSILMQIPYQPEVNPDKVALLDINDALRGLEPLPDFQIYRQLPSEFLVSEDRRALVALSMEANAFMNEGQPEKSVEIFQEILEKWPNEYGIRVALADSLYAVGDHAAAVEEYRVVLEQTPMNFQCLNNLAWLLATTPHAEIKDVNTALIYAEEAKILQPTSHHLWSTLSQIYYELGRYQEAENAIGNALLIAQQSQVQLGIVVNYLVQRDRSMMARQATSLLQ